jgi:uncharacterized protein with FMN-binding domain
MQSEKAFIRIVALTAIVVIGGGALIYSLVSKSNTQTATVATTTQQTTATVPVATGSTGNTQAPAPTPKPTSTYKDGTYSATGSYISPGGDEKLGVTVTLKNDIITSASVTPAPVSPEGRRFQQIFAQNFQPLVVGKDISSVHLTDVSGSSLTPGGFNDALTQIEQQAKA